MKSMLRLLGMLGIIAGLSYPTSAYADDSTILIYAGVVFICDTDTQVEEYVSFLQLGQPQEEAQDAVNDQYGYTVCGSVPITFIEKDTVRSIPIRSENGMVEIRKLQILTATSLATGKTGRVIYGYFQYAPFWVSTNNGIKDEHI